jgi:HUS1 checkpoint protein
MRFRGKLQHPEKLIHIFQALEKVRKECVVRLCKNQILFISLGSQNLSSIAAKEDTTQVWCGTPTNELFSEFRLEAQNTDNQIYIVINLDHAIRALKSHQSAASTVVKLTKKQTQAYLTLDMRMEADNGTIALSQDIPILNILSKDEIRQVIQEPNPGVPRVQIMMPSLKELKPIVDRMQKMGSELEVEANMNGELTIRVANDNVVKVATYFKNLQHPHTLPQQDAPVGVGANIVPQRSTPDNTNSASAIVDIKKFQRFLHAQLVQPSGVCLGMIEDSCLVLNVGTPDKGYLTYFISVINA